MYLSYLDSIDLMIVYGCFCFCYSDLLFVLEIFTIKLQKPSYENNDNRIVIFSTLINATMITKTKQKRLIKI